MGPGRDDFPESPPSSFEDWLDQQAEAENLPREELFQKLISSYWTVNEMSEIWSTVSENPNSVDFPDSASTDGAPTQAESETGSSNISSEKIANLEDQVDELSGQVDDTSDRQTELEKQLLTLAERFSQLSNEIDDESHPDYADLNQLEARIDEQIGQINSQHSARFEDINVLFRHLLNMVESLEKELSRVQTIAQDERDRRRREQALLQTLSQRARELGVTSGICQSCESDVDLTLLARPYCPACGQEFQDLTQKTSWGIFSSTKIHTQDPPADLQETESVGEKASDGAKMKGSEGGAKYNRSVEEQREPEPESGRKDEDSSEEGESQSEPSGNNSKPQEKTTDPTPAQENGSDRPFGDIDEIFTDEDETESEAQDSDTNPKSNSDDDVFNWE